MSYMPRSQPPRLPRAQADRCDRWWRWQREQQRLAGEALECFKAGDTEGFLARDAQMKALPEPDIFNG